MIIAERPTCINCWSQPPCKKSAHTRSNSMRAWLAQILRLETYAMQLRTKLWLTLFVAELAVGTLSARQAPQPNPSPEAHLVRVRTGSYAGRCAGYCASETIIEPGSMQTISRTYSPEENYPDKKTKRAIAKQDWDDLARFINARVLAAFIGRIGCPGCADGGVEWAEVEFSDGTKKSVSYDKDRGPAPITELLQKIESIGTKPKR